MNRGMVAGGYSGTSTENLDLIPLIKTQEEALYENSTVNYVREISFIPSADCTIKVNGGSAIPVKADIPYSNDKMYIGSFTVVEADIDFICAFNW